MKTFITGVFFLLLLNSVKAEINLIPFQFGAENSTDIPTVFWPKQDSKATLVFIPGGSGSFGISKRPDPKPNWVFAELYKSESVPLDLVFMDSHFSLQADQGDPYARWAARRDVRHIERIKITIDHYRKRTGKPVFLFGHSNGSLSLAEFLNQSADNQKMVGGVVFSGSRNETDIKQKISTPTMVLHHRSDSNRWTTPNSAEKLFVMIKQNNSSLTEQQWVEGGKDIPGGDPTHSGRQMYNEAAVEAAELVQMFITRALAK